MRILVILLAASLVACASGVGLLQAQRDCTAQNTSYPTAWNCIKSSVAERRSRNGDDALTLRYFAVGDALSEKVRTGKMTDAEAKAELAVELERDAKASNAENPPVHSVICNQIGATTVCN